MPHNVSNHLSRRLAALAGCLAISLAMLWVSLTLFAPSASASPYCGGQHLSNFGYCYGVSRSLTGDRGYGVSHSVCVGIGGVSGRCSGGPNQIAEFVYIEKIIDEPWIADNAKGETVVYGETF
jgi:hypothetical protein